MHFRTENDYPLGTLKPVLSYDVRRCLEMLWKEFPDEIVDVAFEMIEQREACEKLGWSKYRVQQQVDACRTKARNFLGREFELKDWLCHKHKVSKKS